MKLASNNTRCAAAVSFLLLLAPSSSSSIVHALPVQSTLTPPLLDVPTYSLATVDTDNHTNMNIVTYASPISIQPQRLWTIGILKNSLSHENFLLESGILQLLRPQHAGLVKVLGGLSGRDVDKQQECRELGFEWQSIDETNDLLPLVLPDCSHYLKMTCIHVVDGGSHNIFLCRVDKMWASHDESSSPKDEDDSYLSTRRLRRLGIITEQGRVAEDNDEFQSEKNVKDYRS